MAAAQTLISSTCRLAGAMRSQDKGEPAHRPIQHRGVDPPPVASPADIDKRTEDGDRGLETTPADVRHLHRQGYGWAASGAVQPEGARDGHVVEVVAGARRERAVLPVTGDRAHDQLWVARMKGFPPEAQPSHDAGAVAFNEHVGVLRKAQQEVAARRRLEVQGDTALVAVDCVEEDALAVNEGWRPAQVVAPARLLDLDDVGTHVAQEPGAERAWQQAGQVKYANSGQGHAASRVCPRRKRTRWAAPPPFPPLREGRGVWR